MELIQMKCTACRGGEPTLTDSEIAELHPRVPEWLIVERDSIKRLERVFRFQNFAEALAFTNKVGEIADDERHLPIVCPATPSYCRYGINNLGVEFQSIVEEDLLQT